MSVHPKGDSTSLVINISHPLQGADEQTPVAENMHYKKLGFIELLRIAPIEAEMRKPPAFKRDGGRITAESGKQPSGFVLMRMLLKKIFLHLLRIEKILRLSHRKFVRPINRLIF